MAWLLLNSGATLSAMFTATAWLEVCLVNGPLSVMARVMLMARPMTIVTIIQIMAASLSFLGILVEYWQCGVGSRAAGHTSLYKNGEIMRASTDNNTAVMFIMYPLYTMN